MPCCPDRFLRSGQRSFCFYLSITRTEAFLMASNVSYPDVRSMAFSRSIMLRCLSSTNITLSLCVTFQSYANSCHIELVAQRQHPASFVFSRSNLLWFALFLRVCVISARLGLANGLMIQWCSRCFIVVLIGIVPGIGSC